MSRNEEKAAYLKSLIREATNEAENGHASGAVESSPFSGVFTHELSPSLENLVFLLRNSDALKTLNELVGN